MISKAGTHRVLPPERFYWALLDGSVLPKVGKRDQQLGYFFESFLPVPIDEVQAVYQRLPNGPGDKDQRGRQYIACGMDRSSLQAELGSVPHEVLTLSPSRLPPFISAESEVAPVAFNLLYGSFEPRKVTRLRWRWQLLVISTVILVTAAAIVGLERLAASYTESAQQLDDAKITVYRQLFGDAAFVGGGQPLGLKLTAELRQLRQTRREPIVEMGLTDVTPILAELLAHWPPDLFIQTESVSITPTAIAVRGAAPTSADVQLLANALQPLEGWQLQQPHMSASNGAVQVTLQLKRHEQLGAGGSGGDVQ